MLDVTLAEALLMVALDDERGADATGWSGGIESGLAGALLLNLAGSGFPCRLRTPADAIGRLWVRRTRHA